MALCSVDSWVVRSYRHHALYCCMHLGHVSLGGSPAHF
jgi:hypothetical protein